MIINWIKKIFRNLHLNEIRLATIKVNGIEYTARDVDNLIWHNQVLKNELSQSDIDTYIHDFVRSESFKKVLESRQALDGVAFPVTITYAVERLIITHVKLFMLEDAVRNKELSDEEIGKIKRKIDYWNGTVRPRIVDALGDMMAEAIMCNDEHIIKEPNLKDYKARQ